MISYRNDIDGLRAFAVIAVIIFHLGYLPNGYLGVDVFFVISGYLITSIIYKELNQNSFSIYKFYERRIRRIIPLLLFISSIALIIGLFLMLPDDLENLAQSVVASNFSANNILMLITTADYWATKNEYKPLMHTWSLGIEEQYYLLYPFVLLLISKINLKLIKYFLILITVISLFLFLTNNSQARGFYLLQFRFFELSFGGICAILSFAKMSNFKMTKYLFYFSIAALITLISIPYINNQLQVILATLFTASILTLGKFTHQNDPISKYLFQNKLAIYLGKLSFSLYLWHQLIFAFSRYAYFEKINLQVSILLIIFTILLSIFSYNFIENPFRNRAKISSLRVYLVLAMVFLFSTSSALYIYMIGGMYKDFPSIGLTKDDVSSMGYNMFSSADNVHIHYNENVRQLDTEFSKSEKLKVLVVGNSYGRDVANIFLESPQSRDIELKYFDINRAMTDSTIISRWGQADLVVFAAKDFLSIESVLQIGETHNFKIDLEKVLCFGTKDYGYSNGIHYNKISNINDFSSYYANMRDNTFDLELKLQKDWGEKYVSLISPVINKTRQIRIFTDDGLFISQDTIHLTKAGAKFYANLLNNELSKLLRI